MRIKSLKRRCHKQIIICKYLYVWQCSLAVIYLDDSAANENLSYYPFLEVLMDTHKHVVGGYSTFKIELKGFQPRWADFQLFLPKLKYMFGRKWLETSQLWLETPQFHSKSGINPTQFLLCVGY